MRVAKQMYVRRKATIIKRIWGTRCPSFHPQCVQCIAWRMPATYRWELARNAHNRGD